MPTIAPDRLLSVGNERKSLAPHRAAPRVVDPTFAGRSAAGKVARGWGKAAAQMPGDALELAGKTASAVIHPVATVKSAWGSLMADPLAALKPVALTAGMIGLGVLFPRAMRVVGWAMTASIAVLPTIRFARAASEAELDATADLASRQVVHTGATMAAWWAGSKAVRWGLDRLRGPAEPPEAAGFSTERGAKQTHRVRKGGPDVDPDNLDFAGIRNDREAGAKMVAEVRASVKDELFAARRAETPGLTRAKFEGQLRAAAGRDLRAAYVQEVRRRVHLNVLEAHGVKGARDLAAADLAGMRRHVQDLDDAYDIADAIRGLNKGLASGLKDGKGLAIAAERHLWAERGVPAGEFAKIAGRLGPADLKRVRRFTDAWATSQSGRYLRAAAAAGGQDALAIEAALTRRLAGDMGLALPARGGPDHQTLLSLLRDLEPEGPRSARAVIQAVNEAMSRGETDYLRLNALANRAVLRQLGLSAHALGELEVGDKALRAAFPDLAPAEARAIQTRLLRDALRVLPDEPRAAAVEGLLARKATLIDFEQGLLPFLRKRIDAGLLNNRPLAAHLRGEMSTMQQANLASSLERLPASLREQLFADLKGDPARQARTALDRLASLIESTFDVKVHRSQGAFPDKGWGYDPYVKDWTLQGLVDLRNGLDRMAVGGKLPKAIRGTTFVHMDGDAPGVSMTPGLLRPAAPATPTLARPGADAYPGGTYGEAMTNARGKDIVVLYDTALRVPNADEVAGVSAGEGTVVHEVGHAIQLGGPAGKNFATRMEAEKKLVAEWSSLSKWHEADGALADGWVGDARYYKDPAVRVGARREVATAYAVTDPVEDFAEYTRFFYNDPVTAMRLSPEKFVYFNQVVEGPYSQERLAALAELTGLGKAGLARAIRDVAARTAQAPVRAVNRPGHRAVAG